MSQKSRDGTEHVKNLLNKISSTNSNDNIEKQIKLALNKYDEAITITENLKKKEVGYLRELDEYVTTLSPDTINIGLEELLKIFHWKNTRGVFRPNLKQIQKNTDDSVKTITESAFSKMRDANWVDALDELEKLHGVGPATATCFFAMDKENIPFMCDEALEAITGYRNYNRKSYLQMREELIAKAQLVNMNASDLCQALWAHSVLQTTNPNYLESLESSVENEDTNKKRKRG